MLGDMLMNRVIRKSGERVYDFIDVHFHFGEPERFRDSEYLARDRSQLGRRRKLHLVPGAAVGRNLAVFTGRRDSVKKAVPIPTLRKRAGAAPWPVPIVCIGWPLPQFGVPQSTQWSAPQMASQEFQNSVVMPL